MKYRVMTKQELADKLGISASTLRRYMNELWYKQLRRYNYNKYQKILTRKQVRFVLRTYGE